MFTIFSVTQKTTITVCMWLSLKVGFIFKYNQTETQLAVKEKESLVELFTAS